MDMQAGYYTECMTPVKKWFLIQQKKQHLPAKTEKSNLNYPATATATWVKVQRVIWSAILSGKKEDKQKHGKSPWK